MKFTKPINFKENFDFNKLPIFCLPNLIDKDDLILTNYQDYSSFSSLMKKEFPAEKLFEKNLKSRPKTNLSTTRIKPLSTLSKDTSENNLNKLYEKRIQKKLKNNNQKRNIKEVTGSIFETLLNDENEQKQIKTFCMITGENCLKLSKSNIEISDVTVRSAKLNLYNKRSLLVRNTSKEKEQPKVIVKNKSSHTQLLAANDVEKKTKQDIEIQTYIQKKSFHNFTRRKILKISCLNIQSKKIKMIGLITIQALFLHVINIFFQEVILLLFQQSQLETCLQKLNNIIIAKDSTQNQKTSKKYKEKTCC